MTLDECAPTITNFGDVTAKIQCCATDRCNSFIGKVKFIDMISLVSICWPAQNNVGLDAKKTVFRGLRITKAQTSQRLRLVSAFVIRFLESTISKHASSKISTF